jgi:hypothetical protein
MREWTIKQLQMRTPAHVYPSVLQRLSDESEAALSVGESVTISARTMGTSTKRNPRLHDPRRPALGDGGSDGCIESTTEPGGTTGPRGVRWSTGQGEREAACRLIAFAVLYEVSRSTTRPC